MIIHCGNRNLYFMHFLFFEEGKCNMYDVYLFNMLFAQFLLTQILEILMVNKFL